MKTVISFSVTSRQDISGEHVAKILQRLIDCGLDDATNTIENQEGDVEAAECATNLNISAPIVSWYSPTA